MHEEKDIQYEDTGGAVEAPSDNRSYSYDEFVLGSSPVEIDWEKGFDVREVIGGDIKIKSQKSSSSCVGQAWAYQVWIFRVLEAMKKYGLELPGLLEQHPEDVKEVSAKSIYSFIRLVNGGAYIYRGGKRVVNIGAVDESIVPSNYPNGGCDETLMKDKSWATPEVLEIAKLLRGKDLRVIRGRDDIDLFARAILENNGLVGGLRGANGHGWTSERPKPPREGAKIWGHAIWFGAFGQDKYGKYLATPNSWGKRRWNRNYKWKRGDKPGAGWQKIYIDYFTSANGGNMFNPWTYTDIQNLVSIHEKYAGQLVKNTDSPKVYYVGKGKVIWIQDPEKFNFGRDEEFWGDWKDIKTIPEKIKEDLKF